MKGNTTNTILEREELIALARLAVLGRAAALGDALRDAPEPEALADALTHHGLASIFHVFTRGRTDLPPVLSQRLERAYRQNRARAVVLMGEAQRLMGLFEAAGIPCIPLKGAALAEDLYGDPALRPMTDADLLVPHKHLAEARAIVEKEGYYEEEGDLREGFEEEFRSEISYFRTTPFPIRVELHWGLLNFGGHEAWVPDAFDRSKMTPRGRRLSDEDNLLYLAAHSAYHHQNDRLLWEVDIALILQGQGANLDDIRIGELAQTHRLLMPLKWALETGERLGVPAPPHLAAVLEKRKVGRIERWMLRFARDPELASAVRTILTIRSTPGWRRRFHLMSAKLFPDHRHLEVRHQARGFWPWIYTKRLFRLAGSLLMAFLHRATGRKPKNP